MLFERERSAIFYAIIPHSSCLLMDTPLKDLHLHHQPQLFNPNGMLVDMASAPTKLESKMTDQLRSDTEFVAQHQISSEVDTEQGF
jgi:hypothetical protein